MGIPNSQNSHHNTNLPKIEVLSIERCGKSLSNEWSEVIKSVQANVEGASKAIPDNFSIMTPHNSML